MTGLRHYHACDAFIPTTRHERQPAILRFPRNVRTMDRYYLRHHTLERDVIHCPVLFHQQLAFLATNVIQLMQIFIKQFPIIKQISVNY
jgi:hypothetical protein